MSSFQDETHVYRLIKEELIRSWLLGLLFLLAFLFLAVTIYRAWPCGDDDKECQTGRVELHDGQSSSSDCSTIYVSGRGGAPISVTTCVAQ